MDFLLSTFGVHNPYVNGELPGHAAFPIASGEGAELDLDYTSLLLGEQYTIDEGTYEDIVSGRRAFLNPMAATLLFLKEEGILRTVNLREVSGRYVDEVRRRTELLVADPTDWLPAADAQWRAVGAYMGDFHARHAPGADPLLNTAHFGVYNHLRARDGAVSVSEVTRLTQLLSTRKRILRRQDEEDLREILKPLVAEVMMNEALRSHLGQPLLDWDDARPFYDRIHLTSWGGQAEEARIRAAAKRLLDVTIPDLRPRNIEGVVRFIRDEKAVRSLREEMVAAVRAGAEIDARWFARYVNEAVRRDLTIKGQVKKLRWVGVGVSTAIPGGSLLQEAALNLGQEVVEGALNDSLEQRGVVRHRWYYALQSNAIETEQAESGAPFYKRWIGIL